MARYQKENGIRNEEKETSVWKHCMKLNLLPYQQFLLISSKFSAFIVFPLFHLLHCDVFLFHSILQKRSPNACSIPKVKVKSSPKIEKLQVGPGRTHMASPAN